MEILIIEDELELAKHIKSELTKHDHSVTICHTVSEAIKNDLANNHDIVILDLLLEEERGEDFVRYIKKENIQIPILVLSSLAHVSSKVDLLKAGVDDYMTKPFNTDELLARLESLYRRYLEVAKTDKETHDGITIYWNENKVIREGKEIMLTKKEGKLLKFLVRHKGKIVKSEDILEHVWNVGPGYHSNILQSLVRHLRKRLDTDFDFKLITNVHGIGYKLVFPDEE